MHVFPLKYDYVKIIYAVKAVPLLILFWTGIIFRKISDSLIFWNAERFSVLSTCSRNSLKAVSISLSVRITVN